MEVVCVVFIALFCVKHTPSVCRENCMYEHDLAAGEEITPTEQLNWKSSELLAVTTSSEV